MVTDEHLNDLTGGLRPRPEINEGLKRSALDKLIRYGLRLVVERVGGTGEEDIPAGRGLQS